MSSITIEHIAQDDYDDGIQHIFVDILRDGVAETIEQKWEWPTLKFRSEKGDGNGAHDEWLEFCKQKFGVDAEYFMITRLAKLIEGTPLHLK